MRRSLSEDEGATKATSRRGKDERRDSTRDEWAARQVYIALGNFIAAVRSRKTEDLNADILEGHQSTALCHIANISYRLGRTATHEEVEKQLHGIKVHDNAVAVALHGADLVGSENRLHASVVLGGAGKSGSHGLGEGTPAILRGWRSTH